MVISSLSVINYKNIVQADLAFSPKINCFIGSNGEGKTNLLDAVYYLSFCRSSNTPLDAQVVRHEQDSMAIQGVYMDDDGNEEVISAGVFPGKRKRFCRNRKPYQRLAEHIGLVPLVMVSPQDNVLVTGGGEERRKFTKFKGFDFVGKAKYFICTSLAILVISIVCMGVNGFTGNGVMNLGIDFTSGTTLTIQSDAAIDQADLESQLEELGLDPSSVKINGSESNIASVYLKDAVDADTMSTVKASLQETYGHEVTDNTVTPVIGQELVRNAVIISVLAWIGILIYMSVRFKWDYALSAIVALIHDVLIILAFCAIFRLEINTEIVAVLLTIIGYSVNNSIVVFDRIRDRVRAHRGRIAKEEYRELVNEAIQATCTRSVFSTLTTMLPVIFLLFMGSGAIFVFNLTLLIGLIAGAGSSLFIAAQLWYHLRLREKPKKVKKVKRSKKELDEMIVPGVND